jgi:ubiquinone biosynthesis protein
VPVARRLGRLDLRSLADEIAALVALELDFSLEAESTERVRAAFASDSRVHIPRVYREWSTDRLLVLEYIHGTPIAEVERWSMRGIDPTSVAEHLARIYCTMIFEHGFFHGDPHPGNILVLADGSVALLDFGLAKALPEGFANGVAWMFVKGMAGDAAGAAEAARSIGFSVSDEDADKFLQVVHMMLGDYGGPDSALDLLTSGTLARVPGHFTMIVRALVLLNGLSHMLVPGKRVIGAAMARAMMPYVVAHVTPATAGPPLGDTPYQAVGA